MGYSAFKPFAVGTGANVLDLATWLAGSVEQTGFQSGQVPSNAFNRGLRQASVPGAMLAQWIADHGGGDVADDGNLAVLEQQFTTALAAFIVQQAIASGEGVSISNGAANLAFDPLVAVSSLANSAEFAIFDPATGHHRKIAYSPLAGLILSSIVATQTFQQIATNPILYVRTDGSDSNNGLTNSPGGAFLTPAAALAAGNNQYNFATSGLTIQLGNPGTYTCPIAIPQGSGTITIKGDTGAQANYVLNGQVNSGSNSALSANGFAVLTGLTVLNTSTSQHCISVGSGSTLTLNNVSSQASNGTSGNHLFAPGGILQINNGCSLSGNAGSAFAANSGGVIGVNVNTAVSLLNNPTFSTATVLAANLAQFILGGGASIVGSASGQRYLSINYSIINTNGGGANAVPGSTAGSVNNGIYT